MSINNIVCILGHQFDELNNYQRVGIWVQYDISLMALSARIYNPAP